MKVYLNKSGPLSALAHHIVLEGDEIVNERQSSGLSIADPLALPKAVLEKMGLESNSSLHGEYWLTRWWEGQEFHEQILCGQTLSTLMNDDLGPDVATGFSGVYIRSIVSDTVRRNFEVDGLRAVLRETNYKGPVSMLYAGEDLVSVKLGIPSYGLYAQLEGRSGSIARHLSSPVPFMESWVGALLISRSPFPYPLPVEPEPIEGTTPSTEKHLYLFDHTRFRASFVSYQTKVGVATAWSRRSWADCAERLVFTASQVKISGKQYRTDIVRHFNRGWEKLRHAGILTFQ